MFGQYDFNIRNLLENQKHQITSSSYLFWLDLASRATSQRAVVVP